MGRKEVKNRAILNAAGEAFLRKGMQGATMEEIAQNAGVSKATLYKYYPAKEAILAGLFDHLMRYIQEQVPLHYNADQPLRVLLEALLAQKFELINDPVFLRLVKIISIEQVKKPGYDRETARKMLEEEQNFIMWVKQCQQDQKITTNHPPEVISEWFHGLFYGLMLWPMLLGLRDQFTPEEIPRYTAMICDSFINMFQY